jgi:hypothetical protein
MMECYFQIHSFLSEVDNESIYYSQLGQDSKSVVLLHDFSLLLYSPKNKNLGQ